MLRFYRDFMARVWILLKAAEQQGVTFAEALEGARRNDEHEMIRVIQEGDPQGGDLSLGMILEDIQKSINAGDSSRNDGHLIATLVGYLQRPYRRNVIDTRTLTAIRKALLTPDEYLSMQGVLRQEEYSCGICGKKLETGEILTLSQGGSSDTMLVCTTCTMPTKAACRNCSTGKSLLPEKVRRSIEISTVKCPTCQENKNHPDQPVQVAPDPMIVGPDTFQGLRENIFRVRDRARPIRIPTRIPTPAPAAGNWIANWTNEDEEEI